jgi:hypothetical protein
MQPRIIFPSPVRAYTAESSARAEEIANFIETLTARESEIASQSAHLKESSDWTPEKEQLAQSLSQQSLALQQDWLTVIGQADALLATIDNVEKPVARHEAYEALLAIQTKVRGDLVGIGFIAPPGETPPAHRDYVDNAMIWKHPSVREARAVHDSIVAHNTREIQNKNEAEAEKLRSRISAAIARATSRL